MRIGEVRAPPDGHAIVAGGPQQVLDGANPPGVRVTHMAGDRPIA
jgi:hypothetical protein